MVETTCGEGKTQKLPPPPTFKPLHPASCVNKRIEKREEEQKEEG